MDNTDLEDGRLPTKATFAVGTYSDGSGPAVEVRYYTAPGFTSDRIWIESSSDCWVAVPCEFADELCAAIQSAAKAIKATGERHD